MESLTYAMKDLELQSAFSGDMSNRALFILVLSLAAKLLGGRLSFLRGVAPPPLRPFSLFGPRLCPLCAFSAATRKGYSSHVLYFLTFPFPERAGFALAGPVLVGHLRFFSYIFSVFTSELSRSLVDVLNSS